MSSSTQPTSPSHRNPLTLLSKLKRQLSKSPLTQYKKQPIEHQYLPVPTVSFSSVHSNCALSTHSCSNSRSSFLLIDHNEEPASFGVDEYRPFLPLIIQHERLQHQRLVLPRLAPSSGHRARILPPPNEPPSPTSTASSKSQVTPIFPSFFDNEDDDGIMTMSNSEVGSISEYSLPRTLSAYMDEARNVRSQRSKKPGCQTSSDSKSRHRRGRAMSVRVSLFFFLALSVYNYLLLFFSLFIDTSPTYHIKKIVSSNLSTSFMSFTRTSCIRQTHVHCN